MKLASKLLTFAFCLTSICVHATPSDTDRYVALLADLLERKSIGDDELVQLIENAEQGNVINPISQDRADISISDFIDYETAQKWVDGGKLDAQQVAKWAEENLVEQVRVRKKRKQVKDDTKQPWKALQPERLSAGESHTCAVKADGSVECWGNNKNDRCNAPPDLGLVRSVSAGADYTCAVKADGTVECWGNNDEGQRDVPPDLGVVQSISAGGFHTCAVKADGNVTCWGNNDFGQLKMPLGLGAVQSMSAGASHTCAVKADGIVECWGDNSFGQLDVLSDLGVVQSITAGSYHTCAVKADGTVKCWGDNSHGQRNVPLSLRYPYPWLQHFDLIDSALNRFWSRK